MAFLDLLPPGLFKDFADQVDDWHVETPQPFMFMAMCAALGHLIGYKAYVQYESPHRVFPVMSALLLSPSGICRRGVGSGIVMQIAKDAGALVLDGTVTPEGIVDMLKIAEQRDAGKGTGSRLLVYVEEMGDTFSKKKSQEHLVSKMTALIGRKSDYDDVTRGGMRGPNGEIRPPLRVSRPCLSVLLTSAPDWFIEAMPKEAKSGGLLSRIISMYMEDRDVVHAALATANVPQPTHDLALWSHELRECAESVNGVYHIAPEVNAWYMKWYEHTEMETRKLDESHVRTIRVRRPENMLKLAMLLAAAQKRQQLYISDLEYAHALLDYIEPTMYKFYKFTDAMETTLGQLERRILYVLRDGQDVKHTDFGHRLGPYTAKAGGIRALKVALQGLYEQGQIDYEAKSTVGLLSPFTHEQAWPPKAWRLKNK